MLRIVVDLSAQRSSRPSGWSEGALWNDGFNRPLRKIDQPYPIPTITGLVAGCGQVRHRQYFRKFQIDRDQLRVRLPIVLFDRLDCWLLSIPGVSGRWSDRL